MKTGCGKPVTKGHGDVAVCGKDYYGEIYTCESCLNLRVDELEAVLRECRDEILARAWGLPYNLDEVVAKIDEVLNGKE